MKKQISIQNFVLCIMLIAGIAVAFVIAMILMPQISEAFFPKFRESVSATSTAAMVFATLVLAWGTLRIIDNDRQREKRDRKERYLNEVLSWLNRLEDEIFHAVSKPIAVAVKEDLENSLKGLDVKTIRELEVLDSTLSDLGQIKKAIRYGEYISNLASYLDKDDLHLKIESLVKLLTQRLGLIGEAQPYTEETIIQIKKEVELTDKLGGIEKLFSMDISSLEKAGFSRRGIIGVELSNATYISQGCAS